MDCYEMTGKHLLNLPQVREWQDLQAILTDALAKRPRYWRLPIIACEAAGGSTEQAIPAMAAVACLHISILLIDDMLDEDPRGEYHRRGMAATANLAAAFQAAGLAAITESDIEANIKLTALQSLNGMLLDTAIGQHLDAQNPQDEISYWRVVQIKSSPFFGAALHTGALSARADGETAMKIRQLGLLYGEMIQIHDDLSDSLAIPANPDWLLGRCPLPILFAQIVEHPERKRFLQLREAIPSDPEALVEAQGILVRCGAASYAMDQLLRRHQQARKLLEIMSLAKRDGLEKLFDEAIEPVLHMLSGSGIEMSQLRQPPAIRI